MRIVMISPGTTVTADDIAQFDAMWTNPDQHTKALNDAYAWLYYRYDMMAWAIGDRMGALVRMYEVTQERRYLDQLRGFIEHALYFRDDYHPGDIHHTGEDLPVQPVDEFRGRVMPAWGGKGASSAGFHFTHELASGLYAYPIAAFARIVAEDVALHAPYGADAVRYANEVLKTALAFIPYFDFRQVGNFNEGYLTYPMGQEKCTAELCESEYQKAIVGVTDEEELGRWKRVRNNCNDNRRMAGRPLAHNQNFLFAMALIELWRVLDSPFYKQSPDHSPEAAPQQILLPMLISRLQRYFVNHLKPIDAGTGHEHFFWHGGDDLPSGVNYEPEDRTHGAVTIRYIDVLRRNLERLNVYPAANGEPIPLDDSHMFRFANTFLWKLAAGQNFAEDITGESPNPKNNGDTGGWVNLAVANVEVYKVCHNVWTRTVNGEQPYLGISEYSFLLMNKQYGGRYRYYERSRVVGAPKAKGSPSVIVLPSLGETRVVYRDTQGRIHELWQKGTESGTSNLTGLAGNPVHASGDPKLHIDTSNGLLMALYRGTDGHVHSLYWSSGNVGHDSLSASSPSAPQSAGNPVGYVQKDGTNMVIYRTENKRLQALWWLGQTTPGNENITPADAPNAVGDPAPYINTNNGWNIVPYHDAYHQIHALYWYGAAAVTHENLFIDINWPRVAGDLAAYYIAWNDTHQIAYRSSDGHIHELWWQANNATNNWDLTYVAGAPAAASDPVAYYSAGTNTKHVFYRSADGHLHEIWWSLAGGDPGHVDITFQARAPLAAGKPTAFTVEGPNTQHVVYCGTDGEIHEIRWV